MRIACVSFDLARASSATGIPEFSAIFRARMAAWLYPLFLILCAEQGTGTSICGVCPPPSSAKNESSVRVISRA